MDTERWKRMREIFAAALLREGGERDAFVEEAGEGDEELIAEVRVLLAAHDDSDSFLEVPAEAGPLSEDLGDRLSGRRIGGFALEGVLARGGMGTVYRARQENPERIVAVKVMREGLTSPAAVRRFEYEARILARLTHPGIAQVFEAGTHRIGAEGGTGLPYFVMEYVPDALPITEYARRKGLGTREKLRLFLPVCEAVAYGHQKGIIHRDLKPSNILVDGTGHVKIVDFGVARATDSDLRATTALTDVGQLIGTLQYMSPEQCAADPDDLDTRSDVYALGMVLYELLCEKLPYDVHHAAIFEATRIVRETPPQRPSTVNRRLRGDVETIVLKALEKERPRRYQAVVEFEADIKRHLRGDVILARPVGPVTRAWMRVQRDPAARAAFTVALLAILGFTAYLNFVSLPRIRHEQERTKQKRREAVEARGEAEKNARISRATSEFLRGMLSAPNMFNQGPEARIADVLDRGAESISEVYAGQPEVQLELREILAQTYQNLGRLQRAAEQRRAAVDVSREYYGEEHVKTAIHVVSYARTVLDQLGEEKVRPMVERAVAVLENGLGLDHIDTLYARSILANALFLQEHDDAGAAERLAEILDTQRRLQGPGDENALYTAFLLTQAWQSQGRYEEAAELGHEIVELGRKTLGPEDPRTLVYLGCYGDSLQLLGRHVEAEKIKRELLDEYLAFLGEHHPYTIEAMSGLATSVMELDALPEAETLLLRAVKASEDRYGEDDPVTLSYRNNLALVYSRQGRRSQALEILEDVLERRRAVQRPGHEDTLVAMQNIASTRLKLGDTEGAAAGYRELLEWRLRKNGESHPLTIRAKIGLARALKKLGELEEAESLARDCRDWYLRERGREDPATLDARELLGRILMASGELEKAEALFESGLEIVRDRLPASDPLLIRYLLSCGNCSMLLENWDRGEECFLEIYEVHANESDPSHSSLRSDARRLVRFYEHTGDAEAARRWSELADF